ncbi:MAG: TM0996/MTH895 family glutaredoxin-like protein [Proteobacteria bacterium]|nr:thioredoxin family protein [Desulfobulbaceae bacterium]MBU4152173.1 TM0996/MTH895 family glutaredoxin-like protein [Pseudomonadota bacterium]MDP2106567.1 thioredoxin family protein [Desulfobulbaceae bacterium]
MEIKVCGPGCASCAKAEAVVREAVKEAGVEATVCKVTDFAEMARLGVLSTPAIVVDGVIKCVGKVPAKSDVVGWFS